MHTDESLHSFLIRQQLMCSSRFDPKGVISRDGKWACFPYAHMEVRHIFERFNDLFLLECVEKGKEDVIRSDQFFALPGLYCKSMESTFFREKGERYKKTEAFLDITYCPQCIKEMIHKCGHGYFKKKWNDCDWCDTHDIHLRKIETDSYKTSVKLVQELLHGKDVPSCISIYSQESKVEGKKTNDEESLKLFYPIHATVCSARAIGNFLWQYQKVMQDYFPFMTNEKLYRLMSPRVHISNFYIEAMNLGTYELASLQQFVNLVDYLGDEFSYYEVSVGPREQFSEILLIPDHSRCEGCPVSRCKSLVKKAKKVDSDCREDMLKKSTSYNRFIANVSEIRIAGELPWSPIIIHM